MNRQPEFMNISLIDWIVLLISSSALDSYVAELGNDISYEKR